MSTLFFEPEVIKNYINNKSPDFPFKILHKEKQENISLKNQLAIDSIFVENTQNTGKQVPPQINSKLNSLQKKIKKSQNTSSESLDILKIQESWKIENSNKNINEVINQNTSTTQVVHNENMIFSSQQQERQPVLMPSSQITHNNNLQFSTQQPTINNPQMNNKSINFVQQMPQQPQLMLQQQPMQTVNPSQNYYQQNYQQSQQFNNQHQVQFNQSQPQPQNLSLQKIFYANLLYMNKIKTEQASQKHLQYQQKMNLNLNQFLNSQQQYMRNQTNSMQQQPYQMQQNNINCFPSQKPQQQYCNPQLIQENQSFYAQQQQLPLSKMNNNVINSNISQIFQQNNQYEYHYSNNFENDVVENIQQEEGGNNIDLLTDENESLLREKQSIDYENDNEFSLAMPRSKEEDLQTAKLNKNQQQFNSCTGDNYYNDNYAYSKIHEMEQEIQFQ